MEENVKSCGHPYLIINLSELRGNPGGRMVSLKPEYEFHISRKARLKYNFNESLFTLSGNVILPNFRAARLFAQQMNEKRDVINFPEQAVRAGQVNAMGLIDEILHYVVQLYREQKEAVVMKEALRWLEKRYGKKEVDRALLKFADEFPPKAVYQGQSSLEDYWKGETAGISHREVILEEMVMLWLANLNPAFSPFSELFDDSSLEKETAYLRLMQSLKEFFEEHPPFGPDNQNLIDMLRSPAIQEPHSLSGQLEYIRKKWGLLLGKYFYRLLSSLDMIREEEKAIFLGPGPTKVYEFGISYEEEPERFTPDKDWMPRVILMAKSTYVWLDQLSRKYQRPITRLDQIPDEELDRLAAWGFTGLWLIGLWERSRASRKIKQLCGNPDAVASAYSLLDYSIAQDLGGEEAYQNLRERAWRRGIRMCGDMVPNHMAIDSRWVIEQPDWFIQLDHSPFPSYSYNGPNLSDDERVGIFLEDHYYTRSDAAVTFKRVDFNTGHTRYIYHGNDGTSMPWNDTAQLNYLLSEVREAVIQTILSVARRFSIIRFDAAMTLTKKHYQRLWFPEPGTGGDIPSRAEHGMTRDEFNRHMPEEFWREVVDRISRDAPDTLLLAEAFWLMEGYFVRTLGMHRVYNSAFMNMLKNEENAKYRSSIKNVLEFNPEILKRFVNFMNNPDEETAVAQFGKGDKYFGVCTMMVTMPGLPMFGHGQIEGFTEKYGMEYRRAYWDEQPDEHLIWRHEKEIFPLMKMRYLFAEVENFLLYDFYTPEGYVNENVFAYSNRYGEERALVVYHNKFEHARGWVKTSAAYSVKTGEGEQRQLIQKNLGEGLQLHYDDNYFVIFKDHVSGLEYIRRSKELFDNGLYIELGAFKYQVFLNFREVEDNIWHHFANLTSYLAGRGVPSIDEALRETFLRPIHYAFGSLVNSEKFRQLLKARAETAGQELDDSLLKEIESQIRSLLAEIQRFASGEGELEPVAKRIENRLRALLVLPRIHKTVKCPPSAGFEKVVRRLQGIFEQGDSLWFILFGWVFVHHLGAAVQADQIGEQSRSGMDEWLLGKILIETFKESGMEEARAQRGLLLLKILTRHQNWWKEEEGEDLTPYQIMATLIRDPEVQAWLQVNRFREVLWFNKESFEEFIDYLFITALLSESDWIISGNRKICRFSRDILKRIETFREAAHQSEYQVSNLLDALK
ncbi:MAG: alpha-amylase family glycosyl hydrolase [Calditrichia bacterium]